MSGRPQIPAGSWGKINSKVSPNGGWVSQTRFRNLDDGKFRKISANGKSKSESVRRLTERCLEEQSLQGLVGEVTRAWTMDRLIDKFIDDLPYRDIIANTRNKYKQAANGIIRPKLGSFRVGEMTAGRCESFL